MLRLVLLLLGVGVLGCQADCNVCASQSNIACVSHTQFQFCENNTIVEPLNSCPSGTFCTGGITICQSDPALMACTGCVACNDQKSFACLGVRTFALCLGSEIPSHITGSCAPNYVCNRDNINICGSESDGIRATCPLVDDEMLSTLSPNVNITPDEYCRYVQQTGRFPYGTDLDTTCKQYISCFLSSNIWYGALYNCPGSTYFQSSIKLCNATIPPYCSTAVSSLQFKNLRLL